MCQRHFGPWNSNSTETQAETPATPIWITQNFPKDQVFYSKLPFQ